MSKRRKVIGINAPSEGVEDAINSNLTVQALGKTSQLLEEAINSIKACGESTTTSSISASTSIEGNVQKAHGVVQAIKTLNENAMNKFQNDTDKVKNREIAEKELAVIHQSIVNGEDPLLLKNYKEQVQNCTSLHIDTYRRIHFPSENQTVVGEELTNNNGNAQAQPADGGVDVDASVDFDVNADKNANNIAQTKIASPSSQPYSDMMSAHSKAQELAVVAFLLPKPSETGATAATTPDKTTNVNANANANANANTQELSQDPATCNDQTQGSAQVQVQVQQMTSSIITAAAVAAATPPPVAAAAAPLPTADATTAVPSQSPYTDLLNAHAKTTGTRRSRSRPRPQYKRTRQTQSSNGSNASPSTDTIPSASTSANSPSPAPVSDAGVQL